MKSAITLFAGFLALSQAGKDDSEKALRFSSDSADDTSTSFGGLSIGVYLNAGDSDVPQVVLSQEDDGTNYCLNIERIFEAIDYELTSDDDGLVKCSEDCDYTEVPGSSIGLGDAGCIAEQVTSSIFVIDCVDASFNLTLNFTYVAGDDGSNGLEFTIVFAGYTFISDDENAVLVLEESLEDCSDTRDILVSSDSDEDTDTDSDDDSDDFETTDDPVRRLLDSDDDDDDSGDSGDSGDSSDSSDSNEVDVGMGAFRLTVTTGQDVCEDATSDVALQLVYQSEGDKIQIVAQRFDCTLNIDPWVGINERLDSKAPSHLLAALLVFVLSAVMFV